MNLPQTMRDINICVEAVGHLGTSKKFSLPKIEREREGKKAGGFDKQVDTGSFKELSADFELYEYSDIIYEAMSNGLKAGDGVHLTVKGSIFQNGKSIPAIATLKGSIDIDDGDWEADKAIESKLSMKPTVYILEIDGKERVNIDMNAPQAIINGHDYLADLRSQIA